jgi:serine/threonine protein kinase HipA of HipAB toxin-antitoxin module
LFAALEHQLLVIAGRSEALTDSAATEELCREEDNVVVVVERFEILEKEDVLGREIGPGRG